MSNKNDKRSKEIKKTLKDYSQSKPQQLEFFEVTELSSNEGYSNTIELYDQMPKYYFGGVEREKGREVDALPILRREFKHKHKNYRLEISPAALFKEGKTIHYYPSQREELVEDALRKLVANKRGIYLDDDVAVKFTLYELQQELKSRGHGYNLNEIKEAIEICNKSIIDIMSKEGNQIELSTTIFPFVAKENKSEIDGKQRYIVMFHTLVSKSLKDKTYRLYNYQKVMQYKMNLSRWIHKRMAHNYLQAHISNPYKIKMSTIIRDSGMKEYKKKSDSIIQIEKSLSELKNHNILTHFETDKQLSGRKILDALFSLFVSDEFVSDVKKANKITNRKLSSIHTQEFEDNNIMIRKRLENIRGLSLTVLNNILSKLKDVDDQYTVLDALDAVDEYMKKKPDAIVAAVVKSAINEGWVAKNKKSRLDTRRKLDQEGRYDEKVNISEDLPDISLLNYKKDLEENNRLLELRNNPINKEIFNNISNILGQEIFDKWIKDKMELYDIVKNNSQINEIKFIVPSKFFRDWIVREYKENILNDLRKIDSKFKDIKNIEILSEI